VPTFGSLFAGIGGVDLGLERAGWECRWQVEIDPFCRHVLEHHWPDVPRYGDIRELDWNGVERVDLLAGGFPASRSVPPVNDDDWTTIVGYGPSSPEPFASFAPHTYSWRTSQGSLWGEEWGHSLEVWPSSGMTRSGRAFLRQPSVPRTFAIAFGSSPTPTLWPTPRAQNGEGRNSRLWLRETGPQNLENAMATADPSLVGGSLNPAWVEWLMGFPLGWTDCEHLATRSSRKSSK
jgi:hypothetical protein